MRVDDLGAVPANIDVRAWFPQPAVLRHAAAFVSHAGMGSTMEALYYGVPLVCVPQMVEQEVNAARVAELGLGVRLDPESLTADDLRAAVDAVTGDDAMRAALDRMRTPSVRRGELSRQPTRSRRTWPRDGLSRTSPRSRRPRRPSRPRRCAPGRADR